MLQPKDCLFCFETLTNNDTYDWYIEGCECRVEYHDACIQEWNRLHPQSCPLCRKQVKIYNRQDGLDGVRVFMLYCVLGLGLMLLIIFVIGKVNENS
jgi:hypothetical protein